MSLRTPKGTVDFSGKDAKLIEKVINNSIEVFKLYDAEPLDTPTFELRDILVKKYGDDDKWIFDLEDQGGDICSLRYDLTVPFSRYLAQNNVSKIKRYQVGKVFRRDQPYLSKGRYREFIQCDYDIVGQYLPMTSEAEILKIMSEILGSFEIGDFVIKVNSRIILEGILTFSNVEKELHKSILSSIDKMDDKSMEDLKKEMISKGIKEDQFEKIIDIISIKGGEEILEKIKSHEIFEIESIKKEIENFELLFKYLKAYNCEKNILIDLSLARGADYYTGLIFEAIYKKSKSHGSVMGGGRYDNLVDVLKEGRSVPCIGFSVGVYRIFSILSKKKSQEKNKAVLFATIKEHFVEKRIELMELLRKNKIIATTNFIKRVNLGEQIKYAKKNNIDVILVFGENEIEKNQVDVIFKEERTSVEISKLVEYLNRLFLIQ